MSNQEIHSVILNLNKNFSNNKAYDFKQIVNHKLELKPNSMVALYTGNIVRKPIIIDVDTTLTLDLISAYPKLNQISTLDTTDNVLIADFPDLNVVIPKGKYSRLSFCRILTARINSGLRVAAYQTVSTDIEPITGSATKMIKVFPYKCYYDIKDDEFFLGLRYKSSNKAVLVPGVNTYQFNDSSVSAVPFRDLNDNLHTSNGITIGSNDTIINRTTRVDDWNAYSLGNSPVRGMASHTGEDKDTLGSDIGFITTQIKAEFPSTGTQDMEFVFGLNNTYFSEKWGSGGVNPDLVSLPSEGVNLPQVLIGAYLDMTANTNGTMDKQRLIIFCNRTLPTINDNNMLSETKRDDVVAKTYISLASCDLNAYGVNVGDGCTLRWEIYSENVPPGGDMLFEDNILQEQRVYYFKFYIQSPYNQASQQCIYDSKSSNVSINSDLVESGYLFQQMKCYSDLTKETTAGLCPQFYFKNTDVDFKVISPRCNNIAYIRTEPTLTNTFYYNTGQASYSFTINDSLSANTNTSCLRNVLGIANNSEVDIVDVNNDTFTNPVNTLFNPNAYPRRPELGGLTVLESDKTRYNIELNLPIKAFNTTEGNANDIGQERTILYNTNPVIEDLTQVPNNLVSMNINPPDIKWLSLNNPRALKLNNIDIKIRRAKTNELADELTDVSLELLIKSEN